MSIIEAFDLALLARGAAVDHHHRFALEHGLAVDGAIAGQRGATLFGVEAGDLQRGDHLVADIDRRPNFMLCER